MTAIDRAPDLLTVTVESAPARVGCPTCGTVAEAHSRRAVRLVDAPCFDTPVVLLWRKRRYRCREDACAVRTFTEQAPDLARPRGLLTTRAARWAIRAIRSEHASVQGVARQLGVRWRTVWSAVKPILAAAADDETRFAGVSTLGVDEHVWHHVSTKAPEHGGRGPKELTGMVDLSTDENGQVRARLLDLVQGRTRAAYANWLEERGEHFKAGVDVATLDPFHGYKSAIEEELGDATAVLDAFHVVALGTRCVDEVRRRVQQSTTGHRGRKGDPLYGIQNILRAGAENLTDKQRARIERAFAANETHEAVDLTWQCAQQLRTAYKHADKTEGRKIAERIVATFPSCPIPEIARLGRTLRKWKEAFLAYFTTGATNGGTEAINGLIELHRRIARGLTNFENYRLRMLLIGGGLNL
ncbi:ISL3 family transposase [Ornithinimicrobium pratense]|uniref:ISL3 family transposase n=1 Tax=Ornithinimicrobium pratense TaxID=2593973 RepID=A0A5J6VAX8_9MICO|nr:ISL3 family transposase [Ornithinimicrobium pratense]QFG70372.1 ISL3 family transposase [Ornithinimicrobium pratense]